MESIFNVLEKAKKAEHKNSKAKAGTRKTAQKSSKTRNKGTVSKYYDDDNFVSVFYNKITLSKKIIDELENPTYISFKFNTDSISIFSCSKFDNNKIKLKRNKKINKRSIKSKSLADKIRNDFKIKRKSFKLNLCTINSVKLMVLIEKPKAKRNKKQEKLTKKLKMIFTLFKK